MFWMQRTMKKIVCKVGLTNDRPWQDQTAHENTVPRPAMKKKKVRLRKEVADGCEISSGVLAISSEKNPNPNENKIEAASEQNQGP